MEVPVEQRADSAKNQGNTDDIGTATAENGGNIAANEPGTPINQPTASGGVPTIQLNAMRLIIIHIWMSQYNNGRIRLKFMIETSAAAAATTLLLLLLSGLIVCL